VHNQAIAFDRTDPGAFRKVIAEFDIRMTPRVGRADGFGFCILDTAVYGSTGMVCPPPPHGIPEEPNFTGSVCVGFDIYQNVDLNDLNANHVSLHFDGELLTQVDATPVVDLAGGEWIHAQVAIRHRRRGSDVSVSLTPLGARPSTVIDRFPIPGLEPYEGRVWFGARSGGESADHDLDNVRVRFKRPLGP
jgi:hypothetical protein